MQNALVSVIVPVYKVEKYLDKCVESIVGQTYKNLEIILVDEILSFEKEILNSKIFSKTDKIKVLILSFSPKLYEKIIIRKHL